MVTLRALETGYWVKIPADLGTSALSLPFPFPEGPLLYPQAGVMATSAAHNFGVRRAT